MKEKLVFSEKSYNLVSLLYVRDEQIRKAWKWQWGGEQENNANKVLSYSETEGSKFKTQHAIISATKPNLITVFLKAFS